jgi:NADH-quinone oxidoreductase subunit M
MAEWDLIWMSLVVFLPTVFALVLMFFPRGTEEAMRWWSLLGTAITLGVSILLFIQFRYDTIEKPGILPGSPNFEQVMPQASLEVRAMDMEARGEAGVRRSDDWLARYQWIPRFNIDYFLGADGMSVALVLLTTVLSFLAMIASWKIDRFVRGYCILFLILETGMLGTFLALDFFLFFIFWEVMLLPMYFLIGVWGGPRREYAAIKFFLYTLLGGVFILISLLAFYFADLRDFVTPARAGRGEYHTFDIVVLQRAGRGALQYLRNEPITAAPSVGRAWQQLKDAEAKPVREGDAAAARARDAAIATAQARVNQASSLVGKRLVDQPFFKPWFQYTFFVLLLIGFAIKVPVFPFHTWLPDAHVEAPTPISMILAGVLLKMGGYGIIRIAYPVCPWAAEQLAWWVATFGVINIVYGALTAMAQTDFKKLVAYSSISHMGYVILGVAVWSAHNQYWAWGMNGAVFQMLAHGVSSAGMFFLVGVIYDRAHHRNLDNFRGLLEPMPLYGGLSAVIFFAALGLPGLCGFVGEFMVVLATWNFSPLFSVLAAGTVVLTAAYILWTIQRVFMGTNPQYKNYPDMTVREILCAVPLAVLCVVLGVLPGLVLSWMEPGLTYLVDTLALFKP